MNAFHTSMHAALEETAQDAARFRWMAVHPEEAEEAIDSAWRQAESDADMAPLLRGLIDAARLAETPRPAKGQG